MHTGSKWARAGGQGRAQASKMLTFQGLPWRGQGHELDQKLCLFHQLWGPDRASPSSRNSAAWAHSDPPLPEPTQIMQKGGIRQQGRVRGAPLT